MTRDPVRPSSTVRPFGVVYRVMLRQILTVGRVGVIAALSALGLVSAFAVGANSGTATDAARFTEQFGLVVIVPVIALVFASAALGDLRDDRTLVYLWLRPMPNWLVPTAALTATWTVVIPAVVVPLGAAAALAGGDANVIVGAIAASAAGAIGYSAVFLAASTVLTRVLLWGLAYVLIWEGFIASSEGAARFALRAYTSSILADVSNVAVGLGVHSLSTALLVLTATLVASVGCAVWRYGGSTVD